VKSQYDPMPRTRVKICGITRPEDGAIATKLGADAIGLVFYPPSPRFVDPETAQRIVAALPPLVTVVGLFVNAEPAAVQAVLNRVPLHLLQFHGDEEPEECAAFGLPYLKAVPMGAGAQVPDYEQRFANAAGLLLDSHGGQKMGGTGQGFDWVRIPAQRKKPLILAGGLHPGNIAEAIRQVRPYAVDVSSGVESAKGIKDTELMRAFLQGVYNGESHA
jgi:phosphoribosylanthranilate isomerase